MKIAVIGETSGRVRDAFIARGHDAISCDILPTDVPGPHIQDDARNHNWSKFDMLICHPPCTYLCNSGVRWLYEQQGRWDLMREGAEFFMWCLNQVQRVGKGVVENPIPHRHAGLPKYSPIIQPWQFGHGETKATCLWVEGLELLEPTRIVSGREQRIHKMTPGPDRWKKRSETYQGIAMAMAEQYK